jgi:hypothetical protein
MNFIENYVLSRFDSARSSFLSVHDIDLQAWSMQAAEICNFKNFKASKSFIKRFKQENRIRSRKITQIVSRSHKETLKNIITNANNFKIRIRELIPSFQHDHIFNTDQCGFNIEIPPIRTLAHVGSRDIVAAVQCVNATTHSYTVQHCTTFNGFLLPRFLICLNEITGTFGPRVLEEIKELDRICPNAVIRCSRSGKLDKFLVKTFYNEVLKPEVKENFLILLDSWKAQLDPKLFEEVFNNGIIPTVEQIPAHCTGMIQPLDVFYYRQLKYFIKRLYSTVYVNNLQFNLRSRNGIVRLQSLAHNQLSAPIFKEMIKYSWIKSGYSDEQYERFETMKDVCFGDVIGKPCQYLGCYAFAVMKCSHFFDYCFQHVFNPIHLHL